MKEPCIALLVIVGSRLRASNVAEGLGVLAKAGRDLLDLVSLDVGIAVGILVLCGM